jgi:hypothetical protein
MANQNTVKVIEKNAGPKIAYEQTGTCLIFGDYELMINAAKYQKDWDVTVDICKDKAGNLTIGTESGLRYVAQVMIPAATYTETPIEQEEGVAALSDTDDGMNHDNVLREQNPLDMGDVTLVLWSIE